MHLKISCAKWRPFRPGRDVLNMLFNFNGVSAKHISRYHNFDPSIAGFSRYDAEFSTQKRRGKWLELEINDPGISRKVNAWVYFSKQMHSFVYCLAKVISPLGALLIQAGNYFPQAIYKQYSVLFQNISMTGYLNCNDYEQCTTELI